MISLQELWIMNKKILHQKLHIKHNLDLLNKN